MNVTKELHVLLFALMIFSSFVHSKVWYSYTLPKTLRPLSTEPPNSSDLENTCEEGQTSETTTLNPLDNPALILELSATYGGRKPVIPNECSNNYFKFIFVLPESVTNQCISYACEENGKLITSRRNPTCRNPLNPVEQEIENKPKHSCKKVGGTPYAIGYQIEGGMYTMYETCILTSQNRVIYAKHKLRKRSKLYCEACYPEEVFSAISNEMKEFEDALLEDLLAPNLKESQAQLRNEGKHRLIPFQLVPHEEMVLYTWKMAAKNRKNYSLIWSNVAQNSLRKVNTEIRRVMIQSNYSLDIYTGVHYETQEYPLYIWKIIRSPLLKRAFAIIIHNQSSEDTTNYLILCTKKIPCEFFGIAIDEEQTAKGTTYCCETKSFTNSGRISYLKNKFIELEPMSLGRLFSEDTGFNTHPCQLPSSHAHDVQVLGGTNVSSSSNPASSHAAPLTEDEQRTLDELKKKLEQWRLTEVSKDGRSMQWSEENDD